MCIWFYLKNKSDSESCCRIISKITGISAVDTITASCGCFRAGAGRDPWCLSMKDRKVRRQAVNETFVFGKLVMEKLGLRSSV